MSVKGKTTIYRNIEGVVLAGGLNSRFNGEIKAKLVIEDKPIIAKTLNVLDKIFDRVSIVANEPGIFSDYPGYPIYKDIFQKVGPLGGIHSALSNSEAKAVFVVACDMPNLSEKLIRFMLEHYHKSANEVFIPKNDSFREPLHAIYSKVTLPRLEEYLSSAESYAIKDFLSQTDVGYIDIGDKEFEDNAFTNINSPDDLRKVKASRKI